VQLVTLGRLVTQPVKDGHVIVIEYACVTEAASPQLSVSLIVNEDVPVAVGVPLIAPVEVFRLRPAGRVPLSRLYVSADWPVPATLQVPEEFMVPLASVVVGNDKAEQTFMEYDCDAVFVQVSAVQLSLTESRIVL
jgi:hypothetical protein